MKIPICFKLSLLFMYSISSWANNPQPCVGFLDAGGKAIVENLKNGEEGHLFMMIEAPGDFGLKNYIKSFGVQFDVLVQNVLALPAEHLAGTLSGTKEALESFLNASHPLTVKIHFVTDESYKSIARALGIKIPEDLQ